MLETPTVVGKSDFSLHPSHSHQYPGICSSRLANALLSGACDAVRIPTPLQANHSCLLASARTKVSDHSAHPPDRLEGRQDAPPVESQHALMSGHLALSKQHAEVICSDCLQRRGLPLLPGCSHVRTRSRSFPHMDFSQ